jgi:hypothetical protein
MSKHLAHQLAGYDRDTEVLTIEYDLDPAVFKKIKKMKIVAIDADDPEVAGSYPLNNVQLREISHLTGKTFDNDRYEFFLEPA